MFVAQFSAELFFLYETSRDEPIFCSCGLFWFSELLQNWPVTLRIEMTTVYHLVPTTFCVCLDHS